MDDRRITRDTEHQNGQREVALSEFLACLDEVLGRYSFLSNANAALGSIPGAASVAEATTPLLAPASIRDKHLIVSTR